MSSALTAVFTVSFLASAGGAVVHFGLAYRDRGIRPTPTTGFFDVIKLALISVWGGVEAESIDREMQWRMRRHLIWSAGLLLCALASLGMLAMVFAVYDISN